MKYIKVTRSYDRELVLLATSWIQFVAPRVDGDPKGTTRIQLSGSFMMVQETVAKVEDAINAGGEL